MEINLKFIRLESRPATPGKSILATYNAYFEGETRTGKEPFIKGIRLFQSTEIEGGMYIRLPQIRLVNGKYMDVIALSDRQYTELQKIIVDEYLESNNLTVSNDLKEINIDDIPF